MTIVHFIGAGPGDAELITVKGARLLREADVIVYAGSLVDRELVRAYAPDAEVCDSASMTLEETTAVLAQAVADGKRAVRLHTGDPSIYGAIQEQMAELDRLGIGYAVVPGVTSAFAAAATLRQELTLPEVSQTVIITRLAGRTPVPEREKLSEIAKIGATLVIYLSVSMVEQVVAELLQGAYTPATPVAVVAKASWHDEQTVEGTLADIAGKVREAEIGKQAIILVGDVLKARREGLASKSLLYDRSFSHEFRKGIVT
ncbi:precorrin-4 C(11)-methyltransferase [Geobacter hydrogenophilus]|uniref:Precorrin-4 C(11)-methyltransferase n=1 Tax=Geobacter hydrogenophilus TaxID=40983 RepID=A0A9W6G183_9BACT|nr:precorrin-4 C(11)-methyltransferase [Geobacter hydrogenophilus]MBT0894195.1 precorrin-4 C(11)-methyltransferase [Geobacter hydrogenophilus]GLI38522.1 precorrin-4 C(11)-methyltransferase [Geobacter hydrogenophilus]